MIRWAVSSSETVVRLLKPGLINRHDLCPDLSHTPPIYMWQLLASRPKLSGKLAESYVKTLAPKAIK